MKSASTIVCAIPGPCWNKDTTLDGRQAQLRDLLGSLSILERRISKRVNLAQERARYAALRTQIEGAVSEHLHLCQDRRSFRRALLDQKYPAIRIGPAYFQLLQSGFAQRAFNARHAASRVGAMAIEPGAVQQNRQMLSRLAKNAGLPNTGDLQRRDRFLRKWAGPLGCGIVELLVPLGADAPQPCELALDLPLEENALAWLWRLMRGLLQQEEKPHESNGNGSEPEDWKDYQTAQGDRGEFMEQRLATQIEHGLRGAGSLIRDSNRR